MAEFKSWRSFWHFERAVKGEMRYVRTPDMEAFLDTVRQTAERRVEALPAGTPLWRAQLDCDVQSKYEDGDLVDETLWPYGRDRMKPLHDRAIESRANPKGIPYLYLATDRDTAIAEVRPWIGSYVSVGLFKTGRELKVVNCATADKLWHHVWFEEPSAAEREKSVWFWIDESFARPVTPNENVADYAPTQIIAELFKAHGYDGIAYRSSISETGHNVVLFALDAAEMVQGHVFQVKHVSFKSKEAASPVNYTEQTIRSPDTISGPPTLMAGQ